MSINATDRWYVQLDGQPVAMIENPADADMFWFKWDLRSLEEAPMPADLWDYSTDSRRSFRHVETNEIDSVAIPGGKGILPDGRVLIRGPLRSRSRLLDELHCEPKSLMRRLIQWFIS